MMRFVTFFTVLTLLLAMVRPAVAEPTRAQARALRIRGTVLTLLGVVVGAASAACFAKYHLATLIDDDSLDGAARRTRLVSAYLPAAMITQLGAAVLFSVGIPTWIEGVETEKAYKRGTLSLGLNTVGVQF